MRVSTRIGFGLGLFYLALGFGYAATGGHFVAGFPLLMGAAVGITIFGGYALLAVRRAERTIAEDHEAVEPIEPHIGSTIWPFTFALSAACLVVGFLGSPPMYVVGGIVFVGSALGWFANVRRQWLHSHEEPPVQGPPYGPDTTPLPGERSL